MNSFNHYAYGAIGEWLYRVVAGIEIDPAAPGYKRIIFQPSPGGGLTHAGATLESLYGRIESKWKIEAGVFHLSVVIPANTEGIVHLPAQSIEAVSERGQMVSDMEGVRDVSQEDGQVILTLGSGHYDLSVELSQPVPLPAKEREVAA